MTTRQNYMKNKLINKLEHLEQKAEKGEGIKIFFADVDAQGNESEPKLFMSVKNGVVTCHDKK